MKREPPKDKHDHNSFFEATSHSENWSTWHHISIISSPVMVLMVKLIDEPSSDERNSSANQRRASQFRKIPECVVSYACIFLAISYTFLDRLSHNFGQSSWNMSTSVAQSYIDMWYWKAQLENMFRSRIWSVLHAWFINQKNLNPVIGSSLLLVKIGFPFTGHDFFIHKMINRIVYQ